MEITYLGHASFKLRGRSAVVITDPYSPEMTGLKFPKTEADIVTVSHQHEDHNQHVLVGGAPIVVSGPGEYEIKGVKIIGVATYHDNSQGTARGRNTVYRIEIDGISIIHCGDLGHKLDEKQLEILDDASVLMVPVGGFYTIDATQACEVVSQLDPKIVIPMHYSTPDHVKELSSKLATVDQFLKEIGKEGIIPQPKLVVTKDKLPGEMSVVILE